MEATLELLGHPMPLHEGRRRAHIQGRLVGVCRKGRVVRKHPGQHLQLPVRDVLQRRRCHGRGIAGTSGSLGLEQREDGRMRPVDHAALGGGETRDGLGRGQHLRLAEAERGGGLVVVAGCGAVGGHGGVLVGGVGVVGVVGGGRGGGLGRGRVRVALPLAPFQARIWGELGLPRRRRALGPAAESLQGFEREGGWTHGPEVDEALRGIGGCGDDGAAEDDDEARGSDGGVRRDAGVVGTSRRGWRRGSTCQGGCSAPKDGWTWTGIAKPPF